MAKWASQPWVTFGFGGFHSFFLSESSSSLTSTSKRLDGDMINIDIPARRVDVELSDQELSRRKEEWEPPPPKVTHGYLAHFAKHATSADKGAYLE